MGIGMRGVPLRCPYHLYIKKNKSVSGFPCLQTYYTRREEMRKRITFLVLVMVIIMICLNNRNSAAAQNTSINGRGNLTMDTENINFFNEDIQFLKTEIDKLKMECR